MTELETSECIPTVVPLPITEKGPTFAERDSPMPVKLMNIVWNVKHNHEKYLLEIVNQSILQTDSI